MVVLVKDSCTDSSETDLMACFVLKQHHHQHSHILAWERINRLSYFVELHMGMPEEILDKAGVLALWVSLTSK